MLIKIIFQTVIWRVSLKLRTAALNIISIIYFLKKNLFSSKNKGKTKSDLVLSISEDVCTDIQICCFSNVKTLHVYDGKADIYRSNSLFEEAFAALLQLHTANNRRATDIRYLFDRSLRDAKYLQTLATLQ